MFANFQETIFHTIYEYKKILKRYLPAEEYRNKIKALGIKRKQLKTINEAVLYKLTQTILKDLDNYKTKNYPSLYSGVHEFTKHIKGILKQYHLEDQIVVHTARTASQKIIDMLQIISANGKKVDDKIEQQLNFCAREIMDYGNLEQVDMIINLLRQKESEGSKSLCLLLAKLEAHFQKMLKNPT
jgi:hypothetical protein